MLMLIRSTHPKDDHGLLRFGLQHGFPIISTGCCTNQRNCWTTGTLQLNWNEVWKERRAAKSKPLVPKMGDPSRELRGVPTRRVSPTPTVELHCLATKVQRPKRLCTNDLKKMSPQSRGKLCVLTNNFTICCLFRFNKSQTKPGIFLVFIYQVEVWRGHMGSWWSWQLRKLHSKNKANPCPLFY